MSTVKPASVAHLPLSALLADLQQLATNPSLLASTTLPATDSPALLRSGSSRSSSGLFIAQSGGSSPTGTAAEERVVAPPLLASETIRLTREFLDLAQEVIDLDIAGDEVQFDARVGRVEREALEVQRGLE